MPDIGDIFDHSDIQFLRRKSKSGDLIIVTGNRSSTGELLAYTPATGKTFFLLKAGITSDTITSQVNTNYNVNVQVLNDGSLKDNLAGSAYNPSPNIGISTGAGIGGTNSVSMKVSSTIIGDNLVGNSVKKYSLNVTTINNLTVYGTLIGWIENS